MKIEELLKYPAAKEIFDAGRDSFRQGGESGDNFERFKERILEDKWAPIAYYNGKDEYVVINNNGFYQIEDTNTIVTKKYIIENSFKIYSVRRLRDNKIFMIDGLIKPIGKEENLKIISFEENEYFSGGLAVHVSNGNKRALSII